MCSQELVGQLGTEEKAENEAKCWGSPWWGHGEEESWLCKEGTLHPVKLKGSSEGRARKLELRK